MLSLPFSLLAEPAIFYLVGQKGSSSTELQTPQVLKAVLLVFEYV